MMYYNYQVLQKQNNVYSNPMEGVSNIIWVFTVDTQQDNLKSSGKLLLTLKKN